MIAEMNLMNLIQSYVQVASMRPRSDDRGNQCDQIIASLSEQASMRPRSDDRGNICTATNTWTLGGLQ